MSCSILVQPHYQSSSQQSSSVDEESGYFPSGRSQEHERFKRYFGSSILFLGITSLLTIVVFFLYMADCVFQGLDGEGNCNGGSMIALIISSLLVICGVAISIGLCIRYMKEASVFWSDLVSASVLRGTIISNAYHEKINSFQNKSHHQTIIEQSDPHLETSLTLPISPIKLRQSQVYDEKPIRSFEFPSELAILPRKTQYDDEEAEESSTLL